MAELLVVFALIALNGFLRDVGDGGDDLAQAAPRQPAEDPNAQSAARARRWR
ncbi:hypothetical protein [Thermomonas sp.]|uniref:hypothetical protein n=1 Tax=Thermomonas sp. TaxID=1971895 RepID=UPI0031BBB512